jgi:hypothetical protein
VSSGCKRFFPVLTMAAISQPRVKTSRRDLGKDKKSARTEFSRY